MANVSSYHAFISYRRSDGSSVARWLRDQLQHFRAPSTVEEASASMDVYLDTAYERASWDFYQTTVRPALLVSRYLIVVATPEAAVLRAPPKEDWMWREITDFVEANGPERVLLVRARGHFAGPLPAGLLEHAPNLEVVDLRGASLLSFLNPLRSSRLADELLKIVATLLDVPPAQMPALRREEERRQQRRLGVTAGTLAAVLLGAVSLTTYALTSRWRANEVLESSLFATGRLLTSTVTALEKSGTSADQRSALINDCCDLIDKLGRESPDGVPPLATVVCMAERAAAYDALGERTRGQEMVQAAVSRAEEFYRAEPSSDAAFAVFKAYRKRIALSEPSTDARRQQVLATVDVCERLSRAHPSVLLFAEEGADLLVEVLRAPGTRSDEQSRDVAQRALALTRRALAAAEGDDDHVASRRLEVQRAGLATTLAMVEPDTRAEWVREGRQALERARAGGDGKNSTTIENIDSRLRQLEGEAR